MVNKKRYNSPPDDLGVFLEMANDAHNGPGVPDLKDFFNDPDHGQQAWEKALSNTAAKLRRTCFWVDGDVVGFKPGIIVNSYAWGLEVRKLLTGIIKGQEGERVPVSRPMWGLNDAVLRPGGRVEVETDAAGKKYNDLLEALKLVDKEHLHQCPVCECLYWGRKDKQVCSVRCRVARFRGNNPELWQKTQVRSERKRASRELVQKREREKEERGRLERVHAPTRVRGKNRA